MIQENVAKQIDVAVTLWSINKIITFDEYGVSGHENHIEKKKKKSKIRSLKMSYTSPSNNGTFTSELSQSSLNTLQHSPHLTLQFRAKKKLITEKVTQRQLSKIIKVGASSPDVGHASPALI